MPSSKRYYHQVGDVTITPSLLQFLNVEVTKSGDLRKDATLLGFNSSVHVLSSQQSVLLA
jgi:hypothetical protein